MVSANPLPKCGIDTDSGGLLWPRSKVRARDSSSARSGLSRWARPGGSTHPRIKWSCSQEPATAPRSAATASCRGPRAFMAMNTAPVVMRGTTGDDPPWTEPTRKPTDSVKQAGSTPRTSTRAHHPAARPGWARGSMARKRHSAVARSRLNACTGASDVLPSNIGLRGWPKRHAQAASAKAKPKGRARRARAGWARLAAHVRCRSCLGQCHGPVGPGLEISELLREPAARRGASESAELGREVSLIVEAALCGEFRQNRRLPRRHPPQQEPAGPIEAHHPRSRLGREPELGLEAPAEK